MKKKTYRVFHKQWILEGEASSPHNACRLAFRELIKQGKIKNTPPYSPNYQCGFLYTKVEVV